DVYDAVRAIKEDGGFAVIAHPGQMDSFELIQSLVEEGLDGIERNHFDHTNEHIEQVEQLAKKYNLWMTGGSDYHGVFGKKIHVGEWLSPVEFVKHLEQL
ncbi:MAG TPA: phosphatase, partial [Massilibacterium sp.]|nr:phosphatase [Massilibacterium sp.]